MQRNVLHYLLKLGGLEEHGGLWWVGWHFIIYVKWVFEWKLCFCLGLFAAAFLCLHL